jgi:hypothetical protein
MSHRCLAVPRLFCCFVFNSFIHMCIHCLGHFSTMPPTPTLVFVLAVLELDLTASFLLASDVP